MSTHATVAPRAGKTTKPAINDLGTNRNTLPDLAGPHLNITPNNLLYLQRSMGNQAVLRLLRGESATDSAHRAVPHSSAIMPRLQVGPVDDPYEREADQMATQVMRKSLPIQRDHEGEEEEDESVQLKRATVQRHHDEDETVQTMRNGTIQRNFPHGAAGIGAREDDAIQPHRSYPVKSGDTLQRSSGNHRSGCGCGTCRHVEVAPAKNIQRSAHSPGCSCKECGGVQRKAPAVKKDGSFEADDGLTNEVRKLEGGGRPLPDKVRGDMETRFGADFSGVRIHTSGDAVQMNRSMRADAFTYRQNIAFNAGKYNPGSGSGQRLLAHELTHTLQQTGGLQRAQSQHSGNCKCRNCSGVKRKAAPESRRRIRRHVAVHATGTPTVQRHSSWEHKALGDINPDQLAVLGVYEEMKEARKQAKKQAGWFKQPDPSQVSVQVGPPLNTNITMADFLHVIQQEIDRLKTFRDHPPQEATAQAEQQLVDRARIRQVRKELQEEYGKHQFRQKTKDDYQLAFNQKMNAPIPAEDQWQVRLLAIEHRDPKTNELTGEKTIITYGEMNTLGDFVGDPKLLERISQDNLQKVINGIRQQSMIRFMRLRDQVKGKKTENKNYWGQGFSNTAGSTGRGPIVGDSGIGTQTFGKLGSESVGQLRLMLADKTVIKGEQETAYDAGLARNACHFAPESWITWEKYHREAIRLAQMSVQNRYAAANDPHRAQALTNLAEEFKSRALVQNGFGDHFLQDSFAAGHLINKDEIMKWYQLWLANDPDWNQAITALSNNPATQKGQDFTGGVDVDQESGIGSWRRWDYMKDKTSKKQSALVKGQTGLGVEANRYDINNVGPGQQGKNMQAVENMGGSWQQRFGALGLQLPRSLQPGTIENTVFKKWQKAVGVFDSHEETTPTQFCNKLQLVGFDQVVADAFEQFVEDGVAYTTGTKRFGTGKGEPIYHLRKQYRLVDKRTKTEKFLRKPKKLVDLSDDQDYEERAKKGVYKDYHTYMNNAALQASTNILHDHFCEKGLQVQAGNGTFIGKIYGDDAMFKRSSANGVKFVGETSNLSRDAIYGILNSPPAAAPPPEPVGMDTNTIKQRFPTHVTDAAGGNAMRLDDWHTNGPLKLLCEKVIFPQANRNFWKTFVGGGKAAATTGLTKKISKDVSVHQGDLF